MNNSTDSNIIRDIVMYQEESADCGRLRCVLIENGHAAEFLEAKLQTDGCDTNCQPEHDWREQDIILAEVTRIVPSLAAAFIDLGVENEGMLPLKLAPAGIKTGQPIMVQIRRITAAGKGNQLTARPQLPGFFAVFRPYESRSLKRSKLSELDISDREAIYQKELSQLQSLWNCLEKTASDGGSMPRLLARFQEPVIQALRDWTGPGLRQIHIEGAQLFSQADEILAEYAPEWRKLLRLLPENSSNSLSTIFRLSDLDKQISNRSMFLKNGGRIVFDQTEALLAIDINSAKADRKRDPQKLWLETNMLAAEEIARLLRLRRIQGLIVIDFIRLRSEANRLSLANHFELHLARDSARIQIGGFTRLGLFELTRSLKKQ